MAILRPVRIFLDTRDAIELSHLVNGAAKSGAMPKSQAYQQILRWICRGDCSLIVGTLQMYEWMKGSDSAALEIASVYDLSKTVLRVEGDGLCPVIEVLNEAKRLMPDLPFSAFEILRPFSAPEEYLRFLGNEVFEHLPLGKRVRMKTPPVFPRVSDRVRHNINTKTNSPDWWRDMQGTSEIFRSTFSLTRPRLLNNGLTIDAAARGWLRHGMKMIDVLTPHCGSKAADDFVRVCDFARCPSVTLHTAVMLKYARANTEPKRNDREDFAWLALVAYSDVALIESRMREFITSAERQRADSVFSDPVLACRAIETRLTTAA
ncbi:MAG: hypothetical protein KF678_11020 [Phycisphaeraceae bacterium]|nr:hypothetical protein [Phycisphaeraceae bacterium]